MMRLGYVIMTLVSAVAIVGLALIPIAPLFIWNATASTPTGLYVLRPVGGLTSLDLVAVRPPEPIADYLADRGFLPNGVPLLKHVMAMPGQTVCRTNDTITVDGIEVGNARDRDHLDRPLPRWSGCRTLRPDELFVMNPTVPDSLDGRYFGPLPVTSVIARAVPLWTDEGDDGRFVWRAPTH